MSGPLRFDYYYGVEAEQFSFYRVPRLLIKDERFKGLSSDAKLLYGLMLDRMSLSMKNGWLDDENRAYIIYTIDNIREDLGCSKEKAVKVLAELDAAKGIGLVEKIRRGLGKPDIIYVKNFVIDAGRKEPCNADVSTEVGKTDFKRSEKPTSRSQESRLQEDVAHRQGGGVGGIDAAGDDALKMNGDVHQRRHRVHGGVGRAGMSAGALHP